MAFSINKQQFYIKSQVLEVSSSSKRNGLLDNTHINKSLKLKYEYFEKFKFTNDTSARKQFVRLRPYGKASIKANYKRHGKNIKENLKSDLISFWLLLNNKLLCTMYENVYS